jgi:hypothetical protein
MNRECTNRSPCPGWRRTLGTARTLSPGRSLRPSWASLTRRRLRSGILPALAAYAGSRARAAPSRPSSARDIEAPDGSPGVRWRDCTNRSPRNRSIPDPRRPPHHHPSPPVPMPVPGRRAAHFTPKNGILIRIPARWCNGSTRDFGSLCLGSNPSRAICVSRGVPRPHLSPARPWLQRPLGATKFGLVDSFTPPPEPLVNA